MPSLQLYDKLLQFPLFQGMSRNDLEIVAGHTRFGFQKLPAGRVVVSADDACTSLHFLVSGTLSIETAADARSYVIQEQTQAPYIVQPGAIFGYAQRYTCTVSTLTDCSFLELSKEEIVRLSEDFLVFRLNLLNLFATNAQKQQRRLWLLPPADLRQRIVRFLAARVVYPAGPKTVFILMNHLAALLGDSRLNVSRALNQMQADGLLTLHRGRIEIPQMERLLM